MPDLRHTDQLRQPLQRLRTTQGNRVGKESWSVSYRTADWRRLSVQKRKEVPYCELCGQRDGDVSNPLTADHIQPLSEGGALIVPTFMLRTLCRVCHGKITKHRRTS